MNEITKELLDALKPFAAFFDAVEHMGGNYPKTGAIYSVTSHIGGHRELSVEDFKQAREIIAKAEAALAAPQPADDGWIPWASCECPVPTGTIVDVMYRNGAIGASLPANESLSCLDDDAGPAYWHADGVSNDIIAYRVVKP